MKSIQGAKVPTRRQLSAIYDIICRWKVHHENRLRLYDLGNLKVLSHQNSDMPENLAITGFGCAHGRENDNFYTNYPN